MLTEYLELLFLESVAKTPVQSVQSVTRSTTFPLDL